MTESRIPVGDGELRLRAEISGSGPPFVWAHALMASMRAEDRSGVFDFADTGVERIRYDARSHGRSPTDREAAHHRWDALASDMLEVAGSLGADRAIFGGASMGAATAIWAACLAPRRARALVLAIPPTAWSARAAQSRLYRKLGNPVASPILTTAACPLRLPHPRPPRGTRGAFVDAVLDEVGRSRPTRLASSLRGAAQSDLPSREQIRSIEVPTLILGWRGDRSHPEWVARELASSMPNADLHLSGRDLTGWPQRVAAFIDDLPPEEPGC